MGDMKETERPINDPTDFPPLEIMELSPHIIRLLVGTLMIGHCGIYGRQTQCTGPNLLHLNVTFMYNKQKGRSLINAGHLGSPSEKLPAKRLNFCVFRA